MSKKLSLLKCHSLTGKAEWIKHEQLQNPGSANVMNSFWTVMGPLTKDSEGTIFWWIITCWHLNTPHHKVMTSLGMYIWYCWQRHVSSTVWEGFPIRSVIEIIQHSLTVAWLYDELGCSWNPIESCVESNPSIKSLSLFLNSRICLLCQQTIVFTSTLFGLIQELP